MSDQGKQPTSYQDPFPERPDHLNLDDHYVTTEMRDWFSRLASRVANLSWRLKLCEEGIKGRPALWRELADRVRIIEEQMKGSTVTWNDLAQRIRALEEGRTPRTDADPYPWTSNPGLLKNYRCPFCGKIDTELIDSGEAPTKPYYVRCRQCRATGPHQRTPGTAERSWKNRS